MQCAEHGVAQVQTKRGSTSTFSRTSSLSPQTGNSVPPSRHLSVPTKTSSPKQLALPLADSPNKLLSGNLTSASVEWSKVSSTQSSMEWPAKWSTNSSQNNWSSNSGVPFPDSIPHSNSTSISQSWSQQQNSDSSAHTSNNSVHRIIPKSKQTIFTNHPPPSPVSPRVKSAAGNAALRKINNDRFNLDNSSEKSIIRSNVILSSEELTGSNLRRDRSVSIHKNNEKITTSMSRTSSVVAAAAGAASLRAIRRSSTGSSKGSITSNNGINRLPSGRFLLVSSKSKNKLRSKSFESPSNSGRRRRSKSFDKKSVNTLTTNNDYENELNSIGNQPRNDINCKRYTDHPLNNLKLHGKSNNSINNVRQRRNSSRSLLGNALGTIQRKGSLSPMNDDVVYEVKSLSALNGFLSGDSSLNGIKNLNNHNSNNSNNDKTVHGVKEMYTGRKASPVSVLKILSPDSSARSSRLNSLSGASLGSSISRKNSYSTQYQNGRKNSLESMMRRDTTSPSLLLRGGSFGVGIGSIASRSSPPPNLSSSLGTGASYGLRNPRAMKMSDVVMESSNLGKSIMGQSNTNENNVSEHNGNRVINELLQALAAERARNETNRQIIENQQQEISSLTSINKGVSL